MDWYKLKFTKLESDVMSVLFRNPTTGFNGKELSLKVGASQTAISKAVKSLSKKGIVRIKKNILLSIGLNREEKEIFNLKSLFNLKEIYSSGLLKKLSNEFTGSTIVLFGSYLYGGDVEDSDIDIAIIGFKDRDLDLISLQKKLNRKIQLHFFRDENYIHKDLKENIINGFVLEGGIRI